MSVDRALSKRTRESRHGFGRSDCPKLEPPNPDVGNVLGNLWNHPDHRRSLAGVILEYGDADVWRLAESCSRPVYDDEFFSRFLHVPHCSVCGLRGFRSPRRIGPARRSEIGTHAGSVRRISVSLRYSVRVDARNLQSYGFTPRRLEVRLPSCSS